VALTDSLRNHLRRRLATLALIVLLALVGFMAAGTRGPGAREALREPMKEVLEGRLRAMKKPDGERGAAFPAALVDGEGKPPIKFALDSQEPAPPDTLLKVRDILVGSAYADLTKAEQEIADLLIDAGVLRIQAGILGKRNKGGSTNSPARMAN
jgi:hypothetical protein